MHRKGVSGSTLDRSAVLTYPEDGTTNFSIGEPEEIEAGDDSMNVFLSFPNHDTMYRGVEKVLRGRGLTVYTNFDRTDIEGAAHRTDLRLARILESDAYVHFDDPEQFSTIRQIEFGYALGSEIPVAFVGDPANSLHEYGEVFDDIDDFLSEWYSTEYYERMAQWYSNGSRKAAVA